jgi:DNA-binding Lrp family transcriptional regulator
MRVTAVVDMAAAGYPYQMFCFIRVRGRPVPKVAADVARIDEVLGVFITFGEYDVIALVRAHDLEQIGALVHHDLASVPGVDRVDTDLCVEMRRYYPDVVVMSE